MKGQSNMNLIDNAIKDVRGYIGIYKVDWLGNIYRIISNHSGKLKPQFHKGKYTVKLTDREGHILINRRRTYGAGVQLLEMLPRTLVSYLPII